MTVARRGETGFGTVLRTRRYSMDEQRMQIWVDADACPGPIREILYRVAARTQVTVIFVANAPLRVPPSPRIVFRRVAAGFDEADRAIVDGMAAGDLVITSDIPLAADAIDRGGHALSPRGELFCADTIKGLLNMRDFMDTLRGSGIHTRGPAPLSKADRKAFADHLDRLLARAPRMAQGKGG